MRRDWRNAMQDLNTNLGAEHRLKEEGKMANCEYLIHCPFFNDKMADMPATANLYKGSFCQGDNSQCARYMVVRALGKLKVPTDLFPNDAARAKEILTKG